MVFVALEKYLALKVDLERLLISTTFELFLALFEDFNFCGAFVGRDCSVLGWNLVQDFDVSEIYFVIILINLRLVVICYKFNEDFLEFSEILSIAPR